MSISVTSTTPTSISTFCSYPAGTTITRTKMYVDGTYVGDGSASNNFNYTFSGLTPDTTYTVSVQWFSGAGGANELGSNSVSGTTPPPRPADFTWTYTNVTSGASAVVDYRDWNALINRINAFRLYKGLSTYSMSAAPAGTSPIYASMFNTLVNGANGLAQYMGSNTMPSTKTVGDKVFASYLRGIVNSINSIP